MDKLNDELHDVTRIMTKNMEELLWRGDSLDRTCRPVLFSFFTNMVGPITRNVAFVDIVAVRVGEIS